ncbi:nucleolar and coiled-body phosphoprotein 1-like [Lytechinus pictus]|uniref:nucleolar and coiled-body phosphoprotein 1-like n=1 Tax=Lytechinus pictus TaxID=7653 RepID=UPI0030B9F376
MLMNCEAATYICRRSLSCALKHIGGSEASSTYPAVDMTPSMYTHAPAGTLDSKNKHLTSLELLHHGTRDTNTTKQKVIHVVAPFEPSKSEDMKNAGIKAEPKSEPGEDVEHGEQMSDIQLPEAFRETIKNPIARSVPELMEQGVAVDSKASDCHLPHKPLPSKHTLKQSMQSLKVKQNSVVSQQVVEVESDSKPCHANGKGEYKSEPRKHIVTPPKDYFSHQQTLKESKDSAGRSELKISGKTASAPDVKTTCASGSTGKADHQFRYLNQQKKEAVTHKSKSLGINMKRLRKSPVKKLVEEIPVSYSKRKYGKRRKKSDASSNEKKSDISLASKGMLICDDKKSVHPRKDVTLMVDKDQQKRIPMESNNLKGNHSTSSTSSTGHKHSKHEDGTSIYEIIITPEKKKKHRSRKRSLQIIDDSVIKRTRTKRTTSEMIEMKVVDDSQGSTEKCSLESLNSPSSSMKQSEAGLSSSESSTEQTSLQSKMHFLSRLQVAGDNKSVKLSLSSLSGTPTSSSSTKSSLQSFMRRSLESSPLPEQLTKTALTSSERKTDAKIVHEHSIGRNKLMQRDIPLLSSSSPSPSSATSSSPDLIPSSLYPLSSSNSHPSQLVTKQTSPALQIKKLFGGSSSRDSSTPQESVTVAPRQQRKHSSQQRVKASSIQHRKPSPKEQRTASHMQQRKSTTMKWRRVSPKQERKASPKVPKKLSPMKQRKVSSNVQGQIIDIKATEAERQDSPSDDDDEILLL